MLIVASDLYSLIYQEIIDEITRADDTLVTRAIASAISEIKIYLSRFDLLALFGNDVTAPTVQDEYLKTLCVDMSCWYIIKLANPNISYEHIRNCYNDAIKTLKMIQRGDADPEGWPLTAQTQDPNEAGSLVFWVGSERQSNTF